MSRIPRWPWQSINFRFRHAGKYMFHAHQSEFTELGWMGFLEVVV